MKIESDLLTLSYIYLQRQQRFLHREITTSDILDTCSKVMKRIAYVNSNRKKKIEFKEGYIEF